jgi:hypothetical protein
MKTKTIIIILVILVILAAGTWIFLGNKPASLPGEPDPGNSGNGTGNNGAGSGTPTPAAAAMPLKQGSSGPLVKAIQEALNLKYNSALVTDGSYGPKTLAALKANNLPTVIYWLQWAEITGQSIQAGETLVTPAADVWSMQNAKNWFTYLTTW